MNKATDYLNQLNIDYDLHEHPPVRTVEEAQQHRIADDFGENKNLFLRNKKGSKYYLVTVEASKTVDLKQLAEKLAAGRLGFASEDKLKKYLTSRLAQCLHSDL